MIKTREAPKPVSENIVLNTNIATCEADKFFGGLDDPIAYYDSLSDYDRRHQLSISAEAGRTNAWKEAEGLKGPYVTYDVVMSLPHDVFCANFIPAIIDIIGRSGDLTAEERKSLVDELRSLGRNELLAEYSGLIMGIDSKLGFYKTFIDAILPSNVAIRRFPDSIEPSRYLDARELQLPIGDR